MKYFLAIDCGLTKIKVNLFSQEGVKLFEEQENTPLKKFEIDTALLKEKIISSGEFFKGVQEFFSGVQECRSDASLRSADDSAACISLLFPPTNFSDADDADDADSFCFS
mgnify:CR=1 FL=1